MKKRKKRKFNRNSKRNAERKYDNRNDRKIHGAFERRNRKNKINYLPKTNSYDNMYSN